MIQLQVHLAKLDTLIARTIARRYIHRVTGSEFCHRLAVVLQLPSMLTASMRINASPATHIVMMQIGASEAHPILRLLYTSYRYVQAYDWEFLPTIEPEQLLERRNCV